MAKTATLIDSFSGSLNTSLWNSSYGGVSASGGEGIIPSTSGYPAIATTIMHDFSNSEMYVKMVNVPTGSSRENYFEMFANSNNKVSMYMAAGTLYMRRRQGGTNSQTSIAYNASTHRWWRMRHSGTTLYWDTAPDSSGSPGTWTNRRTLTSSTLDVTNVQVIFSSGFWGSESAANMVIDNVNFDPNAVTNGIKVWNGSSHVVKPVKVWNGSAWVTKPLKRWNGTAWVAVEY